MKAINYGLFLERFSIMVPIKKYLLNKFVLLFCFLLSTGLMAQKIDTLSPKKDSLVQTAQAPDSLYRKLMEYKVDTLESDSLTTKFLIKGDSAAVDAIDLEEVIVLGRLKFENPAARRRYLILQRKTRKVWPYATLAADRLVELNKRLEKIADKSDRKDYIKMIQRYLEGQFKEELKNLTKTEGQILVKLLYRQTGTTTYELVKEFRSGWSAFWYNTTAGFFNISLKEKYVPETVEEDFLIEDILQRSFRKGILEPQKPAIEIDFLELLEKWKG